MQVEAYSSAAAACRELEARSNPLSSRSQHRTPDASPGAVPGVPGVPGPSFGPSLDFELIILSVDDPSRSSFACLQEDVALLRKIGADLDGWRRTGGGGGRTEPKGVTVVGACCRSTYERRSVCREAGMVELIVKPYNHLDITNALHHVHATMSSEEESLPNAEFEEAEGLYRPFGTSSEHEISMAADPRGVDFLYEDIGAHASEGQQARGGGKKQDKNPRKSPKIPENPRDSLYAMLAEDNPSSMKMQYHILCLLGCDAKCVKSGEAAVWALRKQRADIVYMDIHMPGKHTHAVGGLLSSLPMHVLF